MKQQVKRKVLNGSWVEFKFEYKALCFFVKNFTDGDILVSFENDGKEDEAFKIAKGTGEEIAISYGGANNNEHATNVLYVKGTGEVEIQELDARG